MGDEENKQPYWTQDRAMTLALGVAVLSMVLGCAAGWGLRQVDVDAEKGIAGVWESRMRDQMDEANFWSNEAHGYETAAESIALKYQDLLIEQTIIGMEHNATVLELEIDIVLWKAQYELIQQDHIRLQLAYQDLWDIWWDETH